jgi:uncharacterized protein
MNPFILTAYHSPDYFCNRQKETQRLMDVIHNNRNLVLISRRRMGKTGLIKHVEWQLKSNKDVNFIYFDILPSSNIKDFTLLFANAVLNSMSKFSDSFFKSISNIFSSFNPSFSVNPMTGETTFNIDIAQNKEIENSLGKIFEHIAKSKKKFVIAIDEFQQITEYPEGNIEGLLRSYIQHIQNASFIFSGSSRDMLTTMFAKSSRPFYKSSELMFLDNIDITEYLEFINKNFRNKNIELEQKAGERILELTENHTYYVQLLCNRLYSEASSRIDESDVLVMFDKIIEENKFYFENYRNILTEYQWQLLKAIACEHEVSEINAGSFISKYNLKGASSVNSAVKSLLKKEIIINENGKYKIDDLLFSAWLKKII